MHTKLLQRSNRGVTLTPAGSAFLHHGRLMLLHAQQLQDDLREHAKGIRGHVRVQANTSAVSEFLPRVLGSFLAGHPEVSVDLVEQHSPAIVRAVTEERPMWVGVFGTGKDSLAEIYC
jgi:DNA-binding transcriptional LysR family regulator